MIETLFVLIFATFAFFALYDYLYAITAELQLRFTSSRGARAAAVGFNQSMVERVTRVAIIPFAGKNTLIAARPNAGALTPAQAELLVIPDYLAAASDQTAQETLDYERWETVDTQTNRTTERISQKTQFAIPSFFLGQLGRLYQDDGTDLQLQSEHTLSTRWSMENHASHYLK